MGENEFPIIEKDHKWKYRERKTCYKRKGEIWELLANIRTSDMFDSDSIHHIALLDDHHTKELQSAGWLLSDVCTILTYQIPIKVLVLGHCKRL